MVSLLSTGGVQPEGVRSAGILRNRTPLKLTGAVIMLIASLMVYHGKAMRIRYKHFCNDDMYLYIFTV